MAKDQILILKDENNVELLPAVVKLNLDNEMYLIQFFEQNDALKKKYLRAELILVQNYILTSVFCDVMHFMEELALFDYGNDQNKYLVVTEYKKTKNLKLKYGGNEDVFISKTEAKAIYKLFNLSFLGYSISPILEREFRFTPQILTKILHKYKLLLK